MPPGDTAADHDLAALDAAPSGRGVVVVTGGSGGLGRELVRLLARAGWDVAVLARGREAWPGRSRGRGAGRRGLGRGLRRRRARPGRGRRRRGGGRLGPIEVWVNDAMASVFATFAETAPEDFERATRVTYLGQVNGTRAALRACGPATAGHVVQIGSALAFRGIPLQSAYCGSKHAVVGFTESVITELHARGQPGPALDGPHAGDEHHAVRLGPHRLAEAPAAGRADLPARRVRRVVVRWSTIRAGHLGRGADRRPPSSGTSWFAPRLLDTYLARTGVTGQQTDLDRPPR